MAVSFACTCKFYVSKDRACLLTNERVDFNRSNIEHFFRCRKECDPPLLRTKQVWPSPICNNPFRSPGYDSLMSVLGLYYFISGHFTEDLVNYIFSENKDMETTQFKKLNPLRSSGDQRQIYFCNINVNPQFESDSLLRRIKLETSVFEKLPWRIYEIPIMCDKLTRNFAQTATCKPMNVGYFFFQNLSLTNVENC